MRYYTPERLIKEKYTCVFNHPITPDNIPDNAHRFPVCRSCESQHERDIFLWDHKRSV